MTFAFPDFMIYIESPESPSSKTFAFDGKENSDSFVRDRLACLASLVTVFLTAAAPIPVTTFTLVEGLPMTMTVGESYTVVVEVSSDQIFNSAQVLPDLQFPGKGVVAKGGDHSGRGTTAMLEVNFTAKSSTSKIPGGIVPVAVVAGVRYSGGYVAVQRYEFNVMVP